MAINIKSPCFVPRALHNDHPYVQYSQYEMINFAANFYHGTTPQIQSLLPLVHSQTKYLIVDPKTPMFQFGGHKTKPAYNSLLYAIPQDSVLSYGVFTPSYVGQYTSLVIAEQRQHSSNIIVPPYFYFTDSNDPWFKVNIDCTNEACEQKNKQENVLMFVLFDCTLLLRPQSINNLVEKLIACDVDGYYLIAADLNPTELSVGFVKGYQELVSQLSAIKRVIIVAQAGKLGLALIASGADGYAMGFRKLDSIALDTFREGGTDSGQPNRYYFHNLLLPVDIRNADKVAQTNAVSPIYPCNCQYCHSRLPSNIPSKNRTYHYIDYRLAELSNLIALNRNQRQQSLETLFNQAVILSLAVHQELAQSRPFISNVLPPGEFAYLNTIAHCLR